MLLLINRVVKNWKYFPDIKFEKNNFFQNGEKKFGRRYSKQNPDKDLWKKAFSEFNLNPVSFEPIIGNILMNHYLDGAFSHVHNDPAPKGFVHVRANVMLEKPETGGDPIVDDKTINVDKKDLWLVLASLEYHASTPIKGGERLVYSFGSLVKEEEVSKILK